MKKKVVIIVLIILIISLPNLYEYIKLSTKRLTNVSKYVELSNSSHGVKLEVVTYDNIKKLKILNSSPSEIEYGWFYQLEKYEDNKWYSVPFKNDFAFSSEAKILYSKQSVEQKISLDKLDYHMYKGTYRIVKLIILDGEEVYLAVDFSIE